MKTLILLTVLLAFSCTKETIKTVVVEKQTETFEDFERNNRFGGYEVYTALISQTGTNPPNVTVLENTLGPILWNRYGLGEYTGTLLNAFPINKVFIMFEGNGDYYTTGKFRINDNSIGLQNFLNGYLADGFSSSIEIRVYY